MTKQRKLFESFMRLYAPDASLEYKESGDYYYYFEVDAQGELYQQGWKDHEH